MRGPCMGRRDSPLAAETGPHAGDAGLCRRAPELQRSPCERSSNRTMAWSASSLEAARACWGEDVWTFSSQPSAFVCSPIGRRYVVKHVVLAYLRDHPPLGCRDTRVEADFAVVGAHGGDSLLQRVGT